MFDWIERAICQRWEPAARRRFAVHLLVWSVLAAIVNVSLFALGFIDDTGLLLVTLILSWLAITLTAADLIATTDVRKENSSD